ncbi:MULTISPECIES: YkvA family protein [unclassified Pseudomonas]|uniref:YkvA family protein n=1 Tax=unclassified Pseudomonas TaxID=196821 RepID=UPI001CBD7E9D|nr:MULTISPECIES: YkvA family protein [unclassified Pseudomonas]
MTRLLERLRQWARTLKRQTMTLWFCYRHPQTPWLPKWIAIIVVAYALSPIDLIPDFIPVLGYLDDVILLPLGIWLALRLMPLAVLAECADKARQWRENDGQRPVNKLAAALIVLAWIATLAGTWFMFYGGPVNTG